MMADEITYIYAKANSCGRIGISEGNREFSRGQFY